MLGWRIRRDLRLSLRGPGFDSWSSKIFHRKFSPRINVSIPLIQWTGQNSWLKPGQIVTRSYYDITNALLLANIDLLPNFTLSHDASKEGWFPNVFADSWAADYRDFPGSWKVLRTKNSAGFCSIKFHSCVASLHLQLLSKFCSDL